MASNNPRSRKSLPISFRLTMNCGPEFACGKDMCESDAAGLRPLVQLRLELRPLRRKGVATQGAWSAREIFILPEQTEIPVRLR